MNQKMKPDLTIKRRYMLRPVIIFLLLIFGIGAGYADIPGDSLAGRNFDEEKLTSFRESRKFDYGKEPLEEEKDDSNLFSLPDANFAGLLRFFMYVALAVIFVVIAFLILRQTVNRRSRAISSANGLPDLETTDIREIAFEDLISSAVKDGNFRSAVRLLYLETLKKLTEKGWINWKPHKTNHDYYNELLHSPVIEDFSRLTYGYEYIWYGNFPVSAERYRSMEKVFRHFQSTLAQRK